MHQRTELRRALGGGSPEEPRHGEGRDRAEHAERDDHGHEPRESGLGLAGHLADRIVGDARDLRAHDPEVAELLRVAGLAGPHPVEVVTDRDELLDQPLLFGELGQDDEVVARRPDLDLLVRTLHR